MLMASSSASAGAAAPVGATGVGAGDPSQTVMCSGIVTVTPPSTVAWVACSMRVGRLVAIGRSSVVSARIGQLSGAKASFDLAHDLLDVAVQTVVADTGPEALQFHPGRFARE